MIHLGLNFVYRKEMKKIYCYSNICHFLETRLLYIELPLHICQQSVVCSSVFRFYSVQLKCLLIWFLYCMVVVTKALVFNINMSVGVMQYSLLLFFFQTLFASLDSLYLMSFQMHFQIFVFVLITEKWGVETHAFNSTTGEAYGRRAVVWG